MSFRSAVLKVSWNPNRLLFFSNVLQYPKICSNGNCPLIVVLFAASGDC